MAVLLALALAFGPGPRLGYMVWIGHGLVLLALDDSSALALLVVVPAPGRSYGDD